METRIVLEITVSEDTIHGQAKVHVSKWDGPVLHSSVVTYRADAVVPQLEEGHSVYPYAIAAIRDAADRAIAAMMEPFARGEVLLMRDALDRQKM